MEWDAHDHRSRLRRRRLPQGNSDSLQGIRRRWPATQVRGAVARAVRHPRRKLAATNQEDADHFLSMPIINNHLARDIDEHIELVQRDRNESTWIVVRERMRQIARSEEHT